ncbi:MAG: SDR family NAD(P)-dependent oxidoreductase, partial [Mucilaginibacter sp.]
PIRKVADEILASGGSAEVTLVDALDEKAVNDYIDQIIHSWGAIDISFNAIGVPVIQNIPLLDMPMSDFVRPVTTYMQTHFITATAAGKRMKEKGSGVILSLTATPGGIGYPYTGGFGPSCCAIESFSRTLASELGVYGVRVVNIRSGGSPDSKVFRDAVDNQPNVMKHILRTMEDDTMLKKLPLMADIANAAVFLVSDMAGKITGVTIDVTCGTTAALNYRASSVSRSEK